MLTPFCASTARMVYHFSMIIHSDLSGAAQTPTTMDGCRQPLLDKCIKCRSGARTPTACLICLLYTFSNTASGRNTHPSGFKCAKFRLDMLIFQFACAVVPTFFGCRSLEGRSRTCLPLLTFTNACAHGSATIDIVKVITDWMCNQPCRGNQMRLRPPGSARLGL